MVDIIKEGFPDDVTCALKDKVLKVWYSELQHQYHLGNC